jgi:hypothetical protein
MKSAATCVTVLFFFVTSSAAFGSMIETRANSFLIADIELLSSEKKSAFSVAALTMLASAYQREAKRARLDISSNNLTKKRRWASAVERYANHLLILKMDIVNGLSFTVETFPRPIIRVNGKQAMLSYPRPRRQSDFEHELVVRICQQHFCPELLPDPMESVGVTSGGKHLLDWGFSEDGIVCGYGSKRFVFPLDYGLDSSRQACLEKIEQL